MGDVARAGCTGIKQAGAPKSRFQCFTQDWQSERFVFVVSYLFDEGTRGQGLTKIQLELKNTELRKELMADLKRKYGTPRGEIKGSISGPYWENAGDNINYLTDGNAVTIVYAPAGSKAR
jgi:hypothetical protein